MCNTQEEKYPRIGEVYNMYFNGTGSEQSGWRPGVVFQNNIGNSKSPNIIALPLTSSLKKTAYAHSCSGKSQRHRSETRQCGFV